MTTIAQIFTETTPVNSMFTGDTLTLDYSEINTEIQSLNTKLGLNYAILDTIEDNFERLFHALLLLIKLRELDNGNSGFNIKIGAVQPGTGVWNGVTKNQKTFPVIVPFGNDIDTYGDSDNLG